MCWASETTARKGAAAACESLKVHGAAALWDVCVDSLCCDKRHPTRSSAANGHPSSRMSLQDTGLRALWDMGSSPKNAFRVPLNIRACSRHYSPCNT